MWDPSPSCAASSLPRAAPSCPSIPAASSLPPCLCFMVWQPFPEHTYFETLPTAFLLNLLARTLLTKFAEGIPPLHNSLCSSERALCVFFFLKGDFSTCCTTRYRLWDAPPPTWAVEPLTGRIEVPLGLHPLHPRAVSHSWCSQVHYNGVITMNYMAEC